MNINEIHMSVIRKNQNSDTNSSKILLTDHGKDYSKDPLFIKKAIAAKAISEKFGFPSVAEKK
ncbi:MAG: hypothetical protein EOO88_03900 [Pedobacter sp.]|nr:MAG: hypothetical protein EOO88_03900 [Pedobacter sp.]